MRPSLPLFVLRACMWLCRHGVRRSMSLVLLLAWLSLSSLAQDSLVVPPNTPAFAAYACSFDPNSASVTIQASLNTGDGQAFPAQSYEVSATLSDDTLINPNQISVSVPEARPPLQMILVFDNTDTVPLPELINALSTELAPALAVRDEVALISFGESISPITPFYTDKNRLINDHLIDLLPQSGDNRLYDAALEAVNSFNSNGTARRVVLLLTDSGRRQLAQVPLEDIVRRAQANKVQVYPIGFFTRDQPDIVELSRLAQETRGYASFYTDRRNSRESIAAAVSGALADTVRVLNAEIAITLDLRDLSANALGGILVELALQTPTGERLTDSIRCPFEAANHSIRFTAAPSELTVVNGTLDLAVEVESPIAPAERRIIFRVNDDVVQNGAQTQYRFNAADFAPALYRVTAQLWDSSNATLAETERDVKLYAQQTLTLQVQGNPPQPLLGAQTFIVRADPLFPLPPVRLLVAPESQANATQTLGTLNFSATGVASLSLEDVEASIRALLPNLAPEEGVLLSAQVPASAIGDPALALSSAIPIRLQALAVPEEAPPPPPPVVVPLQLPLALIVGLLALNLLLWLWGRRKRIQRWLDTPDNSEMSVRPMTLTVYRGGMRQPHPLTSKTMTIGRGAGNDINLGEDTNISRHHGVVVWRRGAWYYSNRKSRASARINGKRYRGFVRVRLEPVTEIELGGLLLIFHSSAQQDLADFIKTNL